MNHENKSIKTVPATKRGIWRFLRALWPKPGQSTGIDPQPYLAGITARHEAHQDTLADFRDEARFRSMMRGFY